MGNYSRRISHTLLFSVVLRQPFCSSCGYLSCWISCCRRKTCPFFRCLHNFPSWNSLVNTILPIHPILSNCFASHHFRLVASDKAALRNWMARRYCGRHIGSSHVLSSHHNSSLNLWHIIHTRTHSLLCNLDTVGASSD